MLLFITDIAKVVLLICCYGILLDFNMGFRNTTFSVLLQIFSSTLF